MCKLLVDAAPILSGAGIGIDKQDRLGRTILHIAAQHDLKSLTQALLRCKNEGGFGASPLIGDLINQRPIHYAIAFRNEETFVSHLDYLDEQSQQGPGGANYEDALIKLNSGSIPYTLASFCVIKQSWRCFCKLLERYGLAQLQVNVTLAGFDEATRSKTPQTYAAECNASSEYELLVAYFELKSSYPQDETNSAQKEKIREIDSEMKIEQLLADMEESAAATQKTLVITDYRCIEHADFAFKRNIKEKVLQRDKQPENSDRLSLLVD